MNAIKSATRAKIAQWGNEAMMAARKAKCAGVVPTMTRWANGVVMAQFSTTLALSHNSIPACDWRAL